jgi:hypothetical protein
MHPKMHLLWNVHQKLLPTFRGIGVAVVKTETARAIIGQFGYTRDLETRSGMHEPHFAYAACQPTSRLSEFVLWYRPASLRNAGIQHARAKGSIR